MTAKTRQAMTTDCSGNADDRRDGSEDADDRRGDGSEGGEGGRRDVVGMAVSAGVLYRSWHLPIASLADMCDVFPIV